MLWWLDSWGDRVKGSASLAASCSSLCCSHGFPANSFCMVLHIDMLIIRGMPLAPCILQDSQSLTKKCPSWGDKGTMYKNNCLSRICRDLMTELTSTRVNRLRTKKFRNLPQTPAGARCLPSSVTSCPYYFPSLDIKEAWILSFLRMVL